jgi:DNA-binding NarL/FixJ family response regulator
MMEPMDDVSVLIVDDQKPFRDAARTVVKLTGGFTVVGEAATAEEALAVIGDLRPDLVLMDITLRGKLDGIETAQLLMDHYGMRVLFTSAYSDDEIMARANATNPRGYLIKPFAEAQLKKAVERALSNG